MTKVADPPGLDLAEIYRAHRLALLRLAVLLVDDRASAEDAVQDAFMAMHRSSDQLRDPNAVVGYLRTCVINAARSVVRRRQVARKYLHRSLSTDAPPADTEVLLADEHQEVLRALRRLPGRQREVLTLRYWSDLSVLLKHTRPADGVMDVLDSWNPYNGEVTELYRLGNPAGSLLIDVPWRAPVS